MKIIVSVLGILACFMVLGCDSGSNDNSKAVKQQCGNIAMGKCIDYYVGRCNDNDDYQSCAVAADLYNHKKDFNNAIKAYKIVCENINQNTRFTFKDIDGTTKEFNEWESLKKKKSLNCVNLALFYHNGWGVEKNPQKAVEYYDMGCRFGDSEGCNGLGVFFENENVNYDKASRYYAMACKAKNALGCHNLGFMYYKGRGFAINYDIAYNYFKQACELGNKPSCHNATLAQARMSGGGKSAILDVFGK